jgi:hypothetical protein
MSVFVLEDLCLSFRSLPPNEAIVPVVSNDMLYGLVWCRKRGDVGFNVNRLCWDLRSFISCLMSDVVLRLVRGGGRQLLVKLPHLPLHFDLK